MKISNHNYRRGGCLFSLVKIFVLAVVVLCIALYFTLGFVADYALKTITAGTGINAGVSSVSIGISDQKVQVNNFFIANPPDFKQCNAIAFKEAVIDADITLSDALAKKLIVIDEIKVDGLTMNLDVKTAKGISALLSSPQSNITAIKTALENKFGLSNKKDANAQAQQTAKADADAAQWKFIIKKMTFGAGVIDGSVNGSALQISMPAFALENIGTSKGGEPAGELITDIVEQLALIGTSALVMDAVKGGIEAGGDGANSAAKGASKAVENTLKSLFK